MAAVQYEDFDTAARLADEAEPLLQAAELADDGLRAGTIMLSARLRAYVEHALGEATELAGQAVDLHQAAGLSLEASDALRYAASAFAPDLDVDEQIELLSEAADFAARVGDRRGEILSRVQAAHYLAFRGEWTGAKAVLDALPPDYGMGLGLRSHIADIRGDNAAALAIAAQIVITSEASRAFTFGSRMRTLHVAGRSQEASRAASEASDFLAVSGVTPRLTLLFRADFAAAELLDENTARGSYDSGTGNSAGQASRFWACFWRVPLALRLGEIDEAERIAREQLDHATANRLPLQEGRCHLGLAEVAGRRGDLDAARAHLDAAGELFGQLGAKLYLDQVIAKKEILKA